MSEEKHANIGKVKYGFRIHDEISRMIDAHLKAANVNSRSEFLEDAVRYYCCELDSMRHENIITAETARIIRDNIKNLENRLAYILYSIAGEQATIDLILADKLLELNDDEIRDTRNDAYDLVRKRHGFITFKDAMDNARSIAESKDS